MKFLPRLFVKAFVSPLAWGIRTVEYDMPVCEIPQGPNAKSWADLFAASPDLYDALRDVITVYDDGLLECLGSPSIADEALEAGRNALAKANGETQETQRHTPTDRERFDKLERLASQCGKQYWRVNHVGELERSSVKIGDLDWYDSPRAAIDAAPEKL